MPESGITGHIMDLLGVLISPGGYRFGPESFLVTALPGAPGPMLIGPL
jgi:hypothetical protein